MRVLVNDGLAPAREETETRSVSLDRSMLPLNQEILTKMSLSTAVLMEIPQTTDKFVPAYNVLLDKVTFTLGVGPAGIIHHIVNMHTSIEWKFTFNHQRIIFHQNKRSRKSRG